MMTVLVLALPDFSLLFTIETNASGFGLGTVLSQNGRPIAYFSQTLSSRAQAKSIYERELMAVVLAVQKWRHYLLGNKFTVISYQKALKFLVEQHEVQSQFQRWLIKLFGYDFEILNQPGLQNKIVDALSKLTPAVEINLLTSLGVIDVEIALKEVEKDEELQKIVELLKNDPIGSPNFNYNRGIYYTNEGWFYPKIHL